MTLRELTAQDAPAIQQVFAGASAHYTRGREMTPEEAANAVALYLAQARALPRRHWAYGITVAGDLLGLLRFRLRSADTVTVSYVLRENAWGNGYATQAVRQAVPTCFAHATAERLEAKHHPDNVASGRVLDKAGFIRIGVSNVRTEDGTVVPYPVYELRRISALTVPG
ncbi:GNAT family N-acetyltransferase [Streptacidiphilus fuscans]|uniref:GNAT family N-acetyltransferase n=1 Tax=Streptacidiphilus fuscans TaxID=2789292 RepID=UPI002E2CE7E3|nr:GNAT family N-acetyltransferase [Streptacidiphilus fuscans]